MTIRLLTTALNVQSDVVGARQRARQLAQLLGFDTRGQTAIATSVSEIARNAFRYAGGGRVEFEIEGETAPQLLAVRVSDDGPGIDRLDEVLEGNYQSSTGMGIGLIGSRRLMDRWDIHSVPGRGTTVTIGKLLPEGVPFVTPVSAGKLVSRLAAMPQGTSLTEIQLQNAELLGTLAELQDKQDKLMQMARELEDTNRGVVALYAELDEKAMHLRHADEMKSRFLSNMSHEFRTPLNSVRALCSLLLGRADGPLTPDQETQVRFISRAVEDLSELVNDLLDLAKIEAGKTEVRAARFEVAELFSALRGMLKPLLVTESVELVFEDPVSIPAMLTDESKVSQILRNFISNALKFTEQGSVTVTARAGDDGESVVFAVRDTGIGIALEDQELIFEEFTQVPNPLQRRVKGTGLGLPLCRRLAMLLGGAVWVESEPGRGSTFLARIPVRYSGAPLEEPQTRVAESHVPAEGKWVLVIEDEESTRLLYEKFLKETPFGVVSVASLAAGLELMKTRRPNAIVLDIILPGEEEQTWRWLSEMKSCNESIPVIVVSLTGESRKAYSLGADAYFDKPVRRDDLLDALERLVGVERPTALIIDDDEAARYVIRRSLRRPMRFEEAGDGASGLDLATRCQPGVIFLDLAMPGMQGDEVLDRLAADPATAKIPVVIVTSRDLDGDLHERLSRRASAILHKKDISIETLARTLDAIEGRALH
jgi:signal transduction histidine kinase/CheY-like chemotaxis protein